MPVSWSTIASHTAAPPIPKDRYDILTNTYRAEPLRLVLLEALGLLRTPLCSRASPALPLVPHCLVVGIDTEAWTWNTDEMTEIGIVIAEYKDGSKLKGHFGDYAENVLKKMKYHHLRICEHAHLKSHTKWRRGAEGNRFGKSRFVTFAEARDILDAIFNQPIVSDDPDLAGMKRPVVLVGHALSHDKDNFQKLGLQYDFKQNGTVVAEIDTQQLVKELKAWTHPVCSNNDIGLDTLCQEVFGFAHADPHTALNDAARTVICAVNLALRNWDKRYKTKKTMQEVALRIEQHSQHVCESKWGTEFCCTRCGGRDHNNDQDLCKTVVHCAACERFDETRWFGNDIDKTKHIGSHIEQYCLHVAEFNAWKRRVFDAARKNNRLPHGPPPATHHPSNWRGVWPMRTASYVLVPESRLPERLPVLIPAGYVPSTSASVPGVKVVTFQSTGRKRAELAKGFRRKAVSADAVSNKEAMNEKSGTGWSSDDVWNATPQ
jgi:hypothetical protein